MKLSYIIPIVLCPFFICSRAYSQKWIPLDRSETGEAVTVQTLKSDITEHRVKFSIHGIHDNALITRTGVFHQLSIDQNGSLSELGRPSLPVLTQLIAIPEGASVSVSVSEEKWIDVGIGQIYPYQKPLIDGDETKDFCLDETAYKSTFIPQLTQVSNEMEWRGVRNIRVAICPFKYYPNESRLSVLSEFILQVSFQPGKVQMRKKPVYETNDIFHLFDNDIFSDIQQKHSKESLRSGYSYPNGKLLIILASEFSDSINSYKMKEFRKWKALKGFNTYLVTTSTTGNTPESIKNYIQGQYNNSGVRYVLFVGDHGHIPMKYLSSPYYDIDDPYRAVYSDYWYGCMGGDDDFEADVAVGRFSINSWQQFYNMVDKTIKYEKSYQSTNRILLVAHLENAEYTYSPSYQCCCNQIRNATYGDTVTFVTAYGAHHYYGGNEATNSDVVSQINQGAHIVNYRGHAGSDYWGSEQEVGDTIWNYPREMFRSTQINNMNSETCAVFICVACHTGDISPSSSDCMLESFTRAPNGAVAFIGATTSSYFPANNTYNQYIYDKLLNSGVYHIGDVNVSAHIKNLSTMSDITLAEDEALCYLLGGDPTLEIWTDIPQRINNVDVNISNNQVYFSSNINNYVYVSVVHEDGTHMQNSGYYGGNGNFLKPYFDFYFAVNSHNLFPHITYCNLTSHAIEATTFDYDCYSYITPLAIRGGFAISDDDAFVKVKSGSKMIIKNGSGGVTIEDNFKCEQGARFEIK